MKTGKSGAFARIFITVVAASIFSVQFAVAESADDSKRPLSIIVAGQANHVQGIAWDETAGKMYMSFTTRFVVVDKDGNITGSIDRIHGHLGAMTFDSESGKVYASLECKDDAIGSAISNKLGEKHFSTASFYIAVIDVAKVDRLGVPEADALTRFDITPANEDYAAKVECDGKVLEHRYACSGIDGVTIGPAFGPVKGGEASRYLYVAYGIYGDVNRSDNDYQVLLQYPLEHFVPGEALPQPERYFVKTGNTDWGVQNLAYDSFTGKLFMAVYKGKKPQYPNYRLFAVDMTSKASKSRLDGVPYQKSKVRTLPLWGAGWHFKYGSTGLCPLGDGWWYISENFKDKDAPSGANQGCRAVLYRWTGSDKAFE